MPVFRASRVPTNRSDAREVRARLVKLALRDMQRAGINQCSQMVWIGGQSAVIPLARFGEAAQLGIRVPNRARDVRVIVVTEPLSWRRCRPRIGRRQ